MQKGVCLFAFRSTEIKLERSQLCCGSPFPISIFVVALRVFQIAVSSCVVEDRVELKLCTSLLCTSQALENVIGRHNL
eukprot:1422490-Amphidinium_carterae.1